MTASGSPDYREPLDMFSPAGCEGDNPDGLPVVVLEWLHSTEMLFSDSTVMILRSTGDLEEFPGV